MHTVSEILTFITYADDTTLTSPFGPILFRPRSHYRLSIIGDRQQIEEVTDW